MYTCVHVSDLHCDTLLWVVQRVQGRARDAAIGVGGQRRRAQQQPQARHAEQHFGHCCAQCVRATRIMRLAAKRRDASSAECMLHLPLMTGHAAWNDLRSIAPLGAILWNSTAAAAAAAPQYRQHSMKDQDKACHDVATCSQMRRPPIEHVFCKDGNNNDHSQAAAMQHTVECVSHMGHACV